jgi:hypothetical protein
MDLTALAAHAQRGGIPIDVVQLQKSNFAGPQPQAGEQQQYCVVSAAQSSATIAVRSTWRTSLGSIDRGIEGIDQCATAGTPAARSAVMWPR